MMFVDRFDELREMKWCTCDRDARVARLIRPALNDMLAPDRLL
jgi:hypothetical protein